MVIYNSKLICSSDTGVLMIYDLNLSFIKEIKLSSGWGEFYDVTDSYFEVYFPSENLKLYRMNSNYDVISSKSGYKSSKDAIHGKKLIVNEAGNEIETIYGRIRLPVPYGVLQYGGNNIEYSKNVVAYFSIDKPKNKLILNICTLEGQR